MRDVSVRPRPRPPSRSGHGESPAGGSRPRAAERGARADVLRPLRSPLLSSPGDERHHHARSAQLGPPRGRGARRSSRPRGRRVRPPALAPDQGPRVPARQGAALHARAGDRPRRSSSRTPSTGSSRSRTARRSSRRARSRSAGRRSRSGRPRRASRSSSRRRSRCPRRSTLGDYRAFPFAPEIDTIDDAKVDKVVEELRDQQARLDPVEDRGVQAGDYAVIGFTGTRDGVAVRGRVRGARADGHRRGALHPRASRTRCSG